MTESMHATEAVDVPAPPPRSERGWDAWPESDVLWLRSLRAEGLSCGLIALKMGRTRNAVIGKCLRAGIDPPSGFKKRKQIAQRRGSDAIRPPRPRPVVTRPRPIKLPEAPPPVVTLIEPSPETACSLLQLTDQTCRFPIGHVGEEGFHFCGAVPDEKHVYCPYHRKIARQPQGGER